MSPVVDNDDDFDKGSLDEEEVLDYSDNKHFVDSMRDDAETRKDFDDDEVHKDFVEEILDDRVGVDEVHNGFLDEEALDASDNKHFADNNRDDFAVVDDDKTRKDGDDDAEE